MNKNNISMADVRVIIQREINNLNDHERITIRNMADLITAETGIPNSKVIVAIPTLIESVDGAVIEAGRNGGIYKNGRAKIVDGRPRCESCHQVLIKKSMKSSEEHLSQ
jgi:hypothetical protein